MLPLLMKRHGRLDCLFNDAAGRARPPGIVEQAMDAAVAGDDCGHRLLDLSFLANVEGMRLARAAGGLDLAFHRGELVGLAAGDHDVGAQRGDLVRRAAADAAAAAGDEDGLALKQPRFEDRAVRHVSSDDVNGRSSASI